MRPCVARSVRYPSGRSVGYDAASSIAFAPPLPRSQWRLAWLAVAVSCSPNALAAGPGAALYATLAKDAVPPSLAGKKPQVHVLGVPDEERAQGVVGSILVSVPDENAFIRYFVFDTHANAARGYRRYVAEPWGAPMRRIAQDEMKPERGIAPGKVTCELQRNDTTRVYAGACLHVHSTLPVVTRGTQPVKFNDKLKLGDPKVQRAREMLAAAEAVTLAGEGSLQAEKAARR